MMATQHDTICRFWDYHSGNRFQDEQTVVQPGSLESEAGINCMAFDVSGTRLITGEVDKTIKCESLSFAWRQLWDPVQKELPLCCQISRHLQEQFVHRRTGVVTIKYQI